MIDSNAVEAKKFLDNQIYSQTMMENLINDLLDLAKLENHSFLLSEEYFNLGSTIYEAFQILI
jgi:signal transduction histidine kinase